MKQLALIGAGRIGKVHAQAVDNISGVRIRHVCDVHSPSADSLASLCDASVSTLDEIFADDQTDAVIIASATNTHTPLIKRCAESGKPVFCEKPLDLSLATAREAADAVEQSGILCGMGFNRRFDPQFSKLRARVANGDIGQLESLIVISRDPAPPPADYIKVSGGLFRDMMIHDFDIVRWIIDEPITTVFAAGSCLVDAAIGSANDIDTATVTLQTGSGKQAVISNSRRAVYGYDQRIEAFGSQGMLQAMNNTQTNLVHSGDTGVTREAPLHFFLERYEAAYRHELIDFVDALQNNRKPLADHHDGVASLQLAEAAAASLQSGAAVRVDQF